MVRRLEIPLASEPSFDTARSIVNLCIKSFTFVVHLPLTPIDHFPQRPMARLYLRQTRFPFRDADTPILFLSRQASNPNSTSATGMPGHQVLSDAQANSLEEPKSREEVSASDSERVRVYSAGCRPRLVKKRHAQQGDRWCCMALITDAPSVSLFSAASGHGRELEQVNRSSQIAGVLKGLVERLDETRSA